MSVEDADTDRAVVKTYVPAYQRDAWDEHADELDMSRSEFVRSMVQAGRKGFDPRGQADESPVDGPADQTPEADGEGPSPEDTADSGLKERVLGLLEEESRSWEELFAAVTDDVEERLDEAVSELQDENRIRHSGRDGGYVMVE